MAKALARSNLVARAGRGLAGSRRGARARGARGGALAQAPVRATRACGPGARPPPGARDRASVGLLHSDRVKCQPQARGRTRNGARAHQGLAGSMPASTAKTRARGHRAPCARTPWTSLATCRRGVAAGVRARARGRAVTPRVFKLRPCTRARARLGRAGDLQPRVGVAAVRLEQQPLGHLHDVEPLLAAVCVLQVLPPPAPPQRPEPGAWRRGIALSA
jgi:hypothetical protein